MNQATTTLPAPDAILSAWLPFRDLVGVSAVRTEEDHTRALAVIDVLLDAVGEDENHPLADVLDYLSNQVEAYEAAHTDIAAAEPREVLRLLMDQHGLRQTDLADCAPQGRISDILAGRRAVSKEIARKLARRFNVAVDLFF